eukprot:274775-Pyramimonas_sp.AAC.1
MWLVSPLYRTGLPPPESLPYDDDPNLRNDPGVDAPLHCVRPGNPVPERGTLPLMMTGGGACRPSPGMTPSGDSMCSTFCRKMPTRYVYYTIMAWRLSCAVRADSRRVSRLCNAPVSL